MQYWFATSTEEFTPSDMLEQAKAADRAGFDGLGTSDHFAPWFPDGQAANAWVYLGALGQVTAKPIGALVTPGAEPGVVARAFTSLEELYPGRVFLAIDADWRGLDELCSRAQVRPRLYVSALDPRSARIAGRYGDGLWTLGDPERAPEIIDAYRESCRDHGREEGEIVLHAGFTATEDGEKGFLIGSDPAEHVERIREMERAGATVICLQLIGRADPLGSIRTYGERVLPALRRAAVGS